MKIIQTARKHGKTVIVALDSDARVARKGEGRPIQTFIERTTTINFMPVDAIVEIDSDRDMATLFRRVTPDLRVQGWDYKNKPTKFPSIPKCFVRQGSMRTSTIIERCQRCGTRSN
jgi:bifunctional ADP-heptose synthase (sugar kinase/adenylyltransferase)